MDWTRHYFAVFAVTWLWWERRGTFYSHLECKEPTSPPLSQEQSTRLNRVRVCWRRRKCRGSSHPSAGYPKEFLCMTDSPVPAGITLQRTMVTRRCSSYACAVYWELDLMALTRVDSSKVPTDAAQSKIHGHSCSSWTRLYLFESPQSIETCGQIEFHVNALLRDWVRPTQAHYRIFARKTQTWS